MVLGELIAFIYIYANHRFVMGALYLFLPALACIIPALFLLFFGSSANNNKYLISAKVVDFSLEIKDYEGYSKDIFGVYLKYINIEGDCVTSWYQDTDPVIKDLKVGDDVIYEFGFDPRLNSKIHNRITPALIEKFRNGIVCDYETPDLLTVPEDPSLRARYQKLFHHNSFWKFVHNNMKGPLLCC